MIRILISIVLASFLAIPAWAEDADADAKRASQEAAEKLKADPNDPDALLERGTQRAEAGDKDGARGDWLKLLEVAPDSYAAEAARTGLAAIDVHAD